MHAREGGFGPGRRYRLLEMEKLYLEGFRCLYRPKR